ncbi:unnamed protein product [Rotaria sp. Silwood2]|nr:unnamed protein product [Rotaria sp. Silwood2]CAF4391124.1 unnamed protein product [Rotaria sp. Silwood2]
MQTSQIYLFHYINNSPSFSFRYCLEDLANEILYEIFEYLDPYDIYKGFYNLNKRFHNLAIHSNVLTKINVSTMSKSNFEDYYRNILIPNRNQIKLLRLSNPFTADIIFSPPRTILNFGHLETLILDNVQIRYFTKVFNRLIDLPKLHSLTISLVGYNQSVDLLFIHTFRLPKLKYCKIEYQRKDNNNEPFQLYFTQCYSSPIECLIINGRFPVHAFRNLLCCLPKLQHLSIDYLVDSRYYMEQEELSHIELKYLKHVSLKFDLIYFYEFEKIIKEFFYHVEILRLTTHYDERFLNAKRWEKLIMSYMPYLRIFDISHQDSMKNDLRYHDYTYYGKPDDQICSNIQEKNLNSVKHLYIASEATGDDCVNYFPNVNELSIEVSVNSISATLHRMIPLRQLTKLVINSYVHQMKDIINLLRFTPNVHTLSFNLLCLYDMNIHFNKQNEKFQYVLKKNKIQNLILSEECLFSEIQFIVYLFPRLEYLKAEMKKKEIEQIIRFLLSKTHNKTHNLFYLCISKVSKVRLKKTKMVIKSENLLNDHSIKYINRDLHLWW